MLTLKIIRIYKRIKAIKAIARWSWKLNDNGTLPCICAQGKAGVTKIRLIKNELEKGSLKCQIHGVISGVFYHYCGMLCFNLKLGPHLSRFQYYSIYVRKVWLQIAGKPLPVCLLIIKADVRNMTSYFLHAQRGGRGISTWSKQPGKLWKLWDAAPCCEKIIMFITLGI